MYLLQFFLTISLTASFDISEPININFIETGGEALLPGHVLKLKLNPFSGAVDVNVNRDCNLYRGLWKEKSRQTHDFKKLRNSVRFFKTDSEDFESINKIEYNNTLTYFTERANTPYSPQTADTANSISNTTIQFSRIDEILIPDEASEEEYYGAECALPSDNNSEGWPYYVSAVVYGTASSWQVSFRNLQVIQDVIKENTCSQEQEDQMAHLAYPKPLCIERGSITKPISMDCLIGCPNQEECDDSFVADYFIRKKFLTVEYFDAFCIEVTVQNSGKEVNQAKSEYIDVKRRYCDMMCIRECGSNIDCQIDCNSFHRSDADCDYSEFFSYLAFIEYFQADHISSLKNFTKSTYLTKFSGADENKYNQLVTDYCISTCERDCKLLKQQVSPINWQVLIDNYSNFFDKDYSGFGITAYPFVWDGSRDLGQVQNALLDIQNDENQHRPLQVYIKPIPMIVEGTIPPPIAGGIQILVDESDFFIKNISTHACQNSGVCSNSGMKRQHQEDILRDEITVTNDRVWKWRFVETRAAKALKKFQLYFTRFNTLEDFYFNPGKQIKFKWLSDKIQRLYLFYNENVFTKGLENDDFGLSKSDWDCRSNKDIVGSIIGISDFNNNTIHGNYRICKYRLKASTDDDFVEISMPILNVELDMFLAYQVKNTAPSVEDLISGSLTDASGHQVELKNPLPASVAEPWCESFQVNGVEQNREEKKFFSDVAISKFENVEDAYGFKLRQNQFDKLVGPDNQFIKMGDPSQSIIKAGSVLRLKMNREKVEFYNTVKVSFFYSKEHDGGFDGDCPSGFRKFSGKLNGQFNLIDDGFGLVFCKPKSRGIFKPQNGGWQRRKEYLGLEMEFELTEDFLAVFFVHGKFKKGTFDLKDGSTPILRMHKYRTRMGRRMYSYRNTRV